LNQPAKQGRSLNRKLSRSVGSRLPGKEASLFAAQARAAGGNSRLFPVAFFC
jgi:hypothetical protein